MDELIDFEICAVSLSDVGCVRIENEDVASFTKVFYEKSKSYLYIGAIADGVGGNGNGYLAARSAIDYIMHRFNYYKKNIHKQLIDIFKGANETVCKLNSNIYSTKNIACTCVCVVVSGVDLYWASIGDSRLYKRSNNDFVQLSDDHTLVNDLFKKGKINFEEKINHPKRNVITRAFGIKAKTNFDSQNLKNQFSNGDKLLLCSDGLYTYLKDEEMDLFLDLSDIHLSATLMIDLAKQRGGRDNISIVIIAKNFRQIEL